VFDGIEEGEVPMEPDNPSGAWMFSVAQLLEQQQRTTERLVMALREQQQQQQQPRGKRSFEATTEEIRVANLRRNR